MNAPGGIEALVAENEEVPQPVQRSSGSPPRGEISSGFPNVFTGEDVPPGDALDDQIDAIVQNGLPLDLITSVAKGEVLPVEAEDAGLPPIAAPELGTQEYSLARQSSERGGIGMGASPAGNLNLSKFFPSMSSEGGISEDALKMQQAAVSSLLEKQKRRSQEGRMSNNPLSGSILDLAEPVRRATGSGPAGERVEPQMPRPGQIPRNAPNYIKDLMRQGVVPIEADGAPKSTPFSQEEIRERVAAGERRTTPTSSRYVNELSRMLGIAPEIVRQRIATFLDKPAVQAIGRGLGAVGRAAFNPLTAAGMLAADVGYRMAPSVMGVTPIPDEFRTEPGVLPGVNPLPVSRNLPDGSESLANEIPPAVPPGGVPAGPRPAEPLSREAPPFADLSGEEKDSYGLTRQGDSQADVVPFPGLAGPDERRTEVTTTESVPAQQEGESDSDFAKRVRERARLYKEFLGDNEAARKAQAYGILAEVGWRLAGAKGRSLGERLSKGMEGSGAAFAQLAANQAAQERQTMAAAIAAVEQQDRDAMRFATQIRTKQLEIEKSNRPRLQRIEQRAQLIIADNERNRSLNPEAPLITPEGAIRIATMQEDKIVTTDDLGNIRDPSNRVLAYGPANQPTPEGGVGYVAKDYPFLQTGGARPATAFTVEEMKQIREDRAGAQALLAGLQRAKGNLGAVYGPMNVITRGVTSVVQPIVGDIGPIDASNFGAANAIRQYQKDIRELLVLNPNRATKFELELMQPLIDDPNTFFKSPGIALANLLELERTLVNRINAADYKLNPNVEYKQIGPIPLGTKQQPLPSNALGYMGEHFKAVPNSTVYYQRADGRVIGLTKQQYDQMMRGQ
jgi:hypothetical protein